nr:MAG TPA: hypothetical protein [Herelleviridae sp.]
MKNQRLNVLSEITTYSFKVDDNGDVGFLLATGNDFAKNKMTLENAKNIANTGKVRPSDVEGYPICVDYKWYFEGEFHE